MATDRQLLVMRRPPDRAIDAREPAPTLLVPAPDFGRRIGGRVGWFDWIGHWLGSRRRAGWSMVNKFRRFANPKAMQILTHRPMPLDAGAQDLVHRLGPTLGGKNIHLGIDAKT